MKNSLRIASLASLFSLVACAAPGGEDLGTSESDLTKVVIGPAPIITPVPITKPPVITPPPVVPVQLPCGPLNPIACAPASAPLLIVGPAAFTTEMNRLRDHKNATGMPAFVMTMESLRNLRIGRDDAEVLKRVIETMHSQHQTKYVMLAGDASLVPVRRRFVRSDPNQSNGHNGDYNISDNYYANLYRHGANNAFSTWDANNDGFFNEETWNTDTWANNPDAVDGLPDVAVGRVPAHVAGDLSIYVDKVIGYETGRYGIYGLSHGALVAGGTYPNSDGIANDIANGSMLGDIATRWAINFDSGTPAGFAPVTSLGVIDGLFMTTGWVGYVGHGANTAWDIHDSTGGFDNNHVRNLPNANNLPIVWGAACDTAKFAPSLPADGYLGTDGNYHQINYDQTHGTANDNGTPIPYPAVLPPPSVYDEPWATDLSMGGAFLFPANGHGAIAYFGDNVTLDDHEPAELEEYVVNGYRNGRRVLGDMYLDGAATFYAHHQGDGSVFGNPRNYLGIMTMFGDPSLRLY